MNRMKAQAVLAVLFVSNLVMFTNCVPDTFSGDGEVVALDNSDNGTQGLGGEPTVRSSPSQGLAELAGYCAAGAGPVTISGPGLLQITAQCNADGSYKFCTALQNLGQIKGLISQGSRSHNFYAYTEAPISPLALLKIKSVQVLNPGSAALTLKCIPGSSVSGTIYGGVVLKPITCPYSGELSFNAALVPELANSGQRVVYITQISQAGDVSTVFADVDNVSKLVKCSIDRWQANDSLCVDTAGTVSGSCKGGTPVEIYVNGTLQQSAKCSENGTYSAKNVILSLGGASNISVKQKDAFGASCSSDKSMASN